MAEVIDLTKYLKKKEEEDLDELAQRLADLIEDLDLEDQYQMYMSSMDDYIYGMPFIYTMMPPMTASNKVETLSDVTDVLTSLTLQLDSMGHTKWANQISNIVGDMFISGTCFE